VPDRSKLGWIAQDVEEVMPKAVERKEMFGYEDCRTLNSDQLIASLYGSVQKLMIKVEILETEIEELRNNLTSSMQSNSTFSTQNILMTSSIENGDNFTNSKAPLKRFRRSGY